MLGGLPRAEVYLSVPKSIPGTELHDHLSKTYALLDRVIRARKLHHSRFFSLDLDYGHQNYLDILSNQKFIVSRALERLECRAAEVLYEQQKWFKWIRQLENDEETHRENEKKKIRREAALFRRHEKEVQRRRQELKAKEDLQKQGAALEEALRQRQAEDNDANIKDEIEEWDPIEDALDDERGSYIALIKHFILSVNSTVEESDKPASHDDTATSPPFEEILSLQSEDGSTNSDSPATKWFAKDKKGRRPQNKADATAERRPSMSAQDTTEQIRKRLKEGVKPSHARGQHVAGTIENPIELQAHTAPFPDAEIDQLLLEVAEIKTSTSKAASVDDFSSDKDVGDPDLRDLCLKMESPGLQQMRDASADLGRGEEEEDNIEGEMLGGTDEDCHPDMKNRLVSGQRPAGKRGMPKSWAPEREKPMETRR
ncbi:MAG: hypothetical protein Q9194_003771 [Teloschistes cf. exilis]